MTEKGERSFRASTRGFVAGSLALAITAGAVAVGAAEAGAATSGLGGPRIEGATGIWAQRFDRQGGDDWARWVVASPEGSQVFVTGKSYTSATGYDYLTIAYDASTGARLWVSRYDGPGDDYDEAWAAAVSPGGSRLFVTGDSIGAGTGSDYATVAYETQTGRQLWVRRYNGPANDYDQALSVAAAPGGSKVFVTGWSLGSRTNFDYASIAYEAQSGRQVWARRFNGTGDDFDQAVSVAVGPGGSNVYVTGGSYGTTGGRDFATVAYAASSGAQLWVSRYSGGSNAAQAVTASPDGSMVFVTGGDFETLAYDATTGAQLWLAAYQEGTSHASFALTAAPDGSKVFVTGYGSGPLGGAGYATVAYDAASGDQVWAANYSAGAHDNLDTALSIAVSPGGSEVFVTGYIDPGPDYDYATVAYDAGSGQQRWAGRFNGTSATARSVAVSPDGTKVFVTGWSYFAATEGDWVTIAYEA